MDDDGVRVAETNAATGDATTYLIDGENPTDYAKPVEEYLNGAAHRSYALGLRVISQTTDTGASLEVRRLLLDGHGSTRALIGELATAVAQYRYNAFGAPLGFDADAAETTWLFGGDGQYSQRSGLTNHIARWRQGHRFLSLDAYAGSFEDPLSLHKYLYVHGDPVNGWDPSGLSLIGGLGGFTIGLGRNLSSAATAGAALGGLDKVLTAVDIAQIAIQVAVTGTVSPLQVGELAFELLPGSGLLKGLKHAAGGISDALGAQRALNGAGRIIHQMHLSGAIPDVGSNIFRNGGGSLTKISAVHNRYIERIGEIGGGFVAKSLGFVPVNWQKRGVHGIDGIFKKGDQWMILEAKGGVGTLSDTKFGQQMSRDWIENSLKKLPPDLQRELKAARDNGRLFGVISTTHIDGTGKVLDPTFTTKAWNQIGKTTF